MALQIEDLREPGDLSRERIVLRAGSDTDIGRYLVLSARARDDIILAGRVPNCFWFPDRQVRAGDLIILYSKAGSRSVKENNSGTYSYFFYWGLDEALWHDADLSPVLMRVAVWRSLAEEEPNRETAGKVKV